MPEKTGKVLVRKMSASVSLWTNCEAKTDIAKLIKSNIARRSKIRRPIFYYSISSRCLSCGNPRSSNTICVAGYSNRKADRIAGIFPPQLPHAGLLFAANMTGLANFLQPVLARRNAPAKFFCAPRVK